MIKNRTIQLIFQTIYCTLGIVGCIASLGIFDNINVIRWDFYVHFTNISNYFCLGVMIAALIQTVKKKEDSYVSTAPVLKFVGMPGDVLPLALLKSVSGSGALAMIKNIFETSGVDSPSGRLASVMLGSSETTFYALAVYYGITKVKNTRYTVHAAVLADIIGIIAAVMVCKLFFT